MLSHRTLGREPIMLRDRPEQLSVLLDDHRLDDRGLDHLAQFGLEHIDDPSRERARQPVLCGLGDEPVDPGFEFAHPLPVRGVLGLLDQRRESCERLLVSSLGCQAREGDLEQHPGLQKLVELDAARLEHPRDRGADAHPDALLRRRRHEDPAAWTLRGTDQMLAQKHPQRLA